MKQLKLSFGETHQTAYEKKLFPAIKIQIAKAISERTRGSGSSRLANRVLYGGKRPRQGNVDAGKLAELMYELGIHANELVEMKPAAAKEHALRIVNSKTPAELLELLKRFDKGKQ